MKILVVILLLMAAAGLGFLIYQLQDEIGNNYIVPLDNTVKMQTPQEKSSEPVDQFASWSTHTNTKVGFSFRIPDLWLAEDQMIRSKQDVSVLDLFSSKAPYTEDRLKNNVMKAQFQFSYSSWAKGITSPEKYINEWNKRAGNDGSGIPQTIDVNSKKIISNLSGVKIYKYSGGLTGVVYIIPMGADFSEKIHIYVWNSHPELEKVLSSFDLIAN